MTSIIVIGLLFDFVGALVIALSESTTGLFISTLLSKKINGELWNLDRGLEKLSNGIYPVAGDHEELITDEIDEFLITEVREGDEGFQEIKAVIRQFRSRWSIPFHIDALIVVSEWNSEEREVGSYEGKWTGDYDKKTRRGYPIEAEQQKVKNYPTLVYAEAEHYGTHKKETIATFEKLKEWINHYRKGKIRQYGLFLLMLGFGIQIVAYIFL